MIFSTLEHFQTGTVTARTCTLIIPAGPGTGTSTLPEETAAGFGAALPDDRTFRGGSQPAVRRIGCRRRTAAPSVPDTDA